MVEERIFLVESNDKTPMERFDDLLSRIFRAGKQPPKRVPEPEEDAEEILEGGVPPTEGEADE